MSIWQGLGKKAKEVHTLCFTTRCSPQGFRDVIRGIGLGSHHGKLSCHGPVIDICFFHDSRECGVLASSPEGQRKPLMHPPQVDFLENTQRASCHQPWEYQMTKFCVFGDADI